MDSPSLTCRLLRPVAARVYVQWPELQAVVRGSRYAGRCWPNDLRHNRTSEPFDRLLRALPPVEGEEVVVQAASRRSRLTTLAA